MVQLKDDCFAFGGGLVPLDDALSAFSERLGPVRGAETVGLLAARGRIAAEDVTATRSVPPHDNSAVDGYAVYFADLTPDGETRLPVNGRVAAGHPLGRAARRGEAVRIFTGAPMPIGPGGTQADGPDTVFMEEDAISDGDAVRLPQGLKKGSNRRNVGEDVKAGGIVVAKGHRLEPQDLGLAASVGVDRLRVYEPLRAAVFSTGDEIRDPSDDAPEGCVFDANRYTLMALLAEQGCIVTDLGILPDERDAIEDALLDAAADHDVLITSGGVSGGEEDHVKAAVQSHGAVDFWRLAIKPGRPIALGTVEGTAFIGLPGNPAAATVTFLMVARPLIRLLAGGRVTAPTRFKVTADFDYKKKSGRREWVRARLDRREDGGLVARKFRSSGAGILSSIVESDGLVELPEPLERLAAGTQVDFLPFTEMMR